MYPEGDIRFVHLRALILLIVLSAILNSVVVMESDILGNPHPVAILNVLLNVLATVTTVRLIALLLCRPLKRV